MPITRNKLLRLKENDFWNSLLVLKISLLVPPPDALKQLTDDCTLNQMEFIVMTNKDKMKNYSYGGSQMTERYESSKASDMPCISIESQLKKKKKHLQEP